MGRIRVTVVGLILLSLVTLNASAREPLTFEQRVEGIGAALDRANYTNQIGPGESQVPNPLFEPRVPETEIGIFSFSVLAGPSGGAGSSDGNGSSARFSSPWGVTVDSAGNVYAADSGNQTIRKISPAGKATTLAGMAGTRGNADGAGSAARFNTPNDVAVDTSGNVYVANSDNHTIRKITPAGVVTTLAGLAGSYGSADGIGSAARFYWPAGVAVGPGGNIYVADTGNHTIRKVTPAGIVTTLAGWPGRTGSADGTGSAARFYWPYGVTVDAAGNVYVADTFNFTIRKISSAGAVTTLSGLAGSPGSADGTGAIARFDSPAHVAVDLAGSLYVTDSGNQTIRKVGPAGDVTTLAGLAGVAGSADGTGSAARFSNPWGAAVDAAGNVYVGEDNQTIRKVTPSGVVTTLAGLAANSGYADGPGAAALFSSPYGAAVDSSGNAYVGDSGNHIIRKVTPAGMVTTFAGLAGSPGSADGTGSAARFNTPLGVAVDAAGNVYVADRGNHTIREVTSGGVVTTLAGLAGSPGNADGTGSAARFAAPWAVTVDAAGNVYVADRGNHTIRKVTPAGTVTTLAGLAGSVGSADGTGSAARFNTPLGVAVDAGGNVYVADFRNFTIRKITPAGAVTTLAGLAGSGGSVDGTGSAARFRWPWSLAVGSAGNVYVANESTIRRVTPGGAVTTIAGVYRCPGNTDGVGTDARFGSPRGIAVDSGGTLYVTDADSHNIRTGTLPPLADMAAIDASTGPTGVLRQLDTAPQTATAWTWSVERQPAGSTAALSATSSRNPTFIPDAQELYRFRLAASSAAGTRVSTVQLDARCLAFLSSPASSAVCFGTPASFAAPATWTSPPAYQWYKDGFPISGATSSAYTIPSAQLSDAGTYICNASNSCGSAASSPVSLTVSGGPPGAVGDTQRLSQAGYVVSTWSNIAGATEYKLYQDTSANGAFSTLAGTASSGAPGLGFFTSYEPLLFFKVAATNGCGEGPK